MTSVTTIRRRLAWVFICPLFLVRLEDAKTDGIIQFNFRKDDSTRVSLEKNLIAAYGLNDAFVVPTKPNKPATLTALEAKTAAMAVKTTRVNSVLSPNPLAVSSPN